MGPQYSWQRFWCLESIRRDGGELHRRGRNLLCLLYEAHFRPVERRKPRWIRNQRNEFIPMLETQKRVNSGKLSSDALLAYNSLQQKYSVYQRVVQSNINYYLKENPGAWLVYETGYKSCSALPAPAMYRIHFWRGCCVRCASAGCLQWNAKAAWMRFWPAHHWGANTL